jgi:hypothetical protein
VRHTQNGRTLTLPAHYVRSVTELGYATTVHGAQGVTVDTMHGLAIGAESRQQLYTMLTRGTAARARLLLLMADDADPLAELRNAAQQLELDTADDRAAVTDWWLDDTRLHNKFAPLPWLPGIPDRITNNPDWGTLPSR